MDRFNRVLSVKFRFPSYESLGVGVWGLGVHRVVSHRRDARFSRRPGGLIAADVMAGEERGLPELVGDEPIEQAGSLLRLAVAARHRLPRCRLVQPWVESQLP